VQVAASGDRDVLTAAGVSAREAEVLDLLGEHLTNAEIASRLYISARTVEAHVASLLRKLGVASRRELARMLAASTAEETDPALMPPGIGLRADPASFVGRRSELELLRRQWELASSGHTLLVLVTAEAGMGKSRLVSELAAEVAAGGGQVALGVCHEDVDEPYGPFVQVLLDDVRRLPAAEVRRRAGDSLEALARLSRELSRALKAAAGPGRVAELDIYERAMVLDGIRHWLITGASSAPLLVVIEDLHWSTSTTRDVLRQLARRAGREPMLIVATTRDTKPDLDDDVATLLADLVRSPYAVRLALPGLDRDEVGQLVGASSDEAEAMVKQTGGNPLLVTHMTGGDRGSLPSWLVRRDALLDDDARMVLDQAATLGTEFDADLLVAALEAPLLSVLGSLEAAEAAGLVMSHPEDGARFSFVHSLFRSHRYSRLPTRRRLEMHDRAAAALAERSGDDRSLGERARHACLALPIGDPRAAVDLAREAGHRAERSSAYDEAITHYRRGLEAARLVAPPDPTIELDLTTRIGAARHHSGDPGGLPMLLDAARRARTAGDSAALVRAAVAIPQFGAVGFIDPMPEGRLATEAALATLGDEPSSTRARLLVDLASHWLFVDVDEALVLAREAESIARDLGDPEVLGAVLLAARHTVSHPSRIDERVRIGVELERLGHLLGHLPMRLAGLHAQATAHLDRGQIARWMDGFEQFTTLLGQHSLAFFQLQAINYRANRAFLVGDLERAEELAAGTVPLSLGIGAGRVFAEGTIVANRRLQGRDHELVARYERATKRSSDAWYRCALAAAQARSGQIDTAAVTLTSVQDEGFPIREIYPWCVAVTDLAEAAEVAGVPEVAAHVLTVAAPYSGRIAVSGPCPNRPFDQALAQAALATGDTAAAESYAAKAVAASRRRDTPVFLVRELVFLARARHLNGASADEVGSLVREASALAERIGAMSAVADIERYQLSS
jgi:DNA-binding CsgD family transcriptional regulator